MQNKFKLSVSMTSAIVFSALLAGSVSAQELTELEYLAERERKGVVLLGVNWGRAWDYCGYENVQLQSLSFDHMPIKHAGDSPPGDVNLKGAKLTAEPVSVRYALLLDPGEYALTAFYLKAARSVNDVGAFQEYLLEVQNSYPFLDVRNAKYRLFQTTTIGYDFELPTEATP